MPDMSRREKLFVNRRGARSYLRMLDRLDRAGVFPIGSDAKVLELGAGNAALSALLFQRYHPAEIRVTDYDPEQLEVARRNLTGIFGSIPAELVLERADATRLQYSDGAFDLVVAHEAIHHFGPFESIRKGLDEIGRVLRPNGRFLYVEMFHKPFVRDHLARRGFETVYRRRAFRLFAWADIVVVVHRRDATRPAGSPEAGVPTHPPPAQEGG